MPVRALNGFEPIVMATKLKSQLNTRAVVNLAAQFYLFHLQ